MKFVDAYILAATKRKTRRIRTALVVIVGSLLFAVLFFLAFILQGLMQGAKQVEDVGFNGRYLTTIEQRAAPKGMQDAGAKQKEVEAAMQAELKARKIRVTEELKRQDSSYYMELGSRMSAFYNEQQAKELVRLEEMVRARAKPTAIYHFETLPIDVSSFGYQPDPAKDPLVDELVEREETGVAKTKGLKFDDGQLSYHTVESGMLRSQLQPGQTFDWKEGDAYPVVISYAYMESLAGQSFAKMDTKTKVAGYRKLMKEFAGRELAYCYRNSTAQSRLQGVVSYNKTARTDKDAKTAPLDIPVCGGFDEAQLKKLKIVTKPDASLPKPAFPSPPEPEPRTQAVRLKIVGYVSGMSQQGQDVIAKTVSEIGALPVYTPNPIVFPSEVVKADPLLKTFLSGDDSARPFNMVNLFADFANREDQAQFVALSCKGNECSKGDLPFIAAFGNVAVALEDIFRTITKFVLLGVLAVIIIAGLMTMFTISKVIADSTKEIAVFRALGARRRDIAQIYYTYGMMLTIATAVVAVVLAVIGALVVNSMYHDRVATALIQGAGAYNTDVQVTLFGLNSSWLLLIVAAMVLASVVGIGIPLANSLRRKLVTILREE